LNTDKKPGLSQRFEDALIYATRLHASQNRKRSNVPYIAHLLGVTALVLEDGGDEDEAIAALLHDAVEDQGGLKTLIEIKQLFGEHVAVIVDALTDAYTFPKPPWRQRKIKYIEAMRLADDSIRRVSLADKVYNARATLADIRRDGQSAWKKFKEGKEGTLWYYHELIRVFSEQGQSELWKELKRVVAEIECVCNEG
jgi:(p)ppGpp synthase/HD superfamily hydrolase